MRFKYFFCLVSFFIGVNLLASAQNTIEDEDKSKKILVMPFVNNTKYNKLDKYLVSKFLAEDFKKIGKFKYIYLKNSNIIDDFRTINVDKASKLGKRMNVNYVLIGDIEYKEKNNEQKYGKFIAHMKLVDIKTKEIKRKRNFFLQESNMFLLLKEYENQQKAISFLKLSASELEGKKVEKFSIDVDSLSVSRCISKGKENFYGGNYTLAKKYFEKALEKDKNNPDIYYNMARTLLKINKIGKALKYIKTASQLYKSQRNDFGFANSIMEMGNVYFSKKNYREANEFYEKAGSIAEKNKFDFVLLKFYNNLGAIALRKKDWDTSLRYLKKALEFIESGNDYLKSIIFGNIAYVYQAKAEGEVDFGKKFYFYNLAEKYYKKNLETVKKLNNPLKMAYIYLKLGNINRNKNGSFGKTLELSLKTLEISNKYGLKKEILISYFNIGLEFWNKGKDTLALQFFEKTLELCDVWSFKDDEFKYAIYKNLAGLYRDIGYKTKSKDKYRLSLKYYHKAVAIKKKKVNTVELAIVYYHLSQIYKLLEDYDNAIKFMQKSVDICKELDYPGWKQAENELRLLRILKEE